MYYKSDFSGCLISLIIFLIALYLLKELWWLIVGITLIIIVAYWGKRIYFLLKNKKFEEKESYNPQMGEVYKVCPYCNTKVKVTDSICPNCKNSLN